MTAQEIFDRVWRHFVTEGNPRSVTGTACAYRGESGARCAVGLFIPDDEYLPSMEGRSVSHALGPTISGLLTEGHDALFDDLQNAHDSSEDDGLAASLRVVAGCHGLKVPS